MSFFAVFQVNNHVEDKWTASVLKGAVIESYLIFILTKNGGVVSRR